MIYLQVLLYNFECLQERVCKLCLKLIAGVSISFFSQRNAQFISRATWTLSHHLFLQTKEGTVMVLRWHRGCFLISSNLSHLTEEAELCRQISSFSKSPLVRCCISFSDFPGNSNFLWKEVDHGYKYKEAKIATFLSTEYNELFSIAKMNWICGCYPTTLSFKWLI